MAAGILGGIAGLVFYLVLVLISNRYEDFGIPNYVYARLFPILGSILCVFGFLTGYQYKDTGVNEAALPIVWALGCFTPVTLITGLAISVLVDLIDEETTFFEGKPKNAMFLFAAVPAVVVGGVSGALGYVFLPSLFGG